MVAGIDDELVVELVGKAYGNGEVQLVAIAPDAFVKLFGVNRTIRVMRDELKF